MTIIDRNPATVFESTTLLYQSGDYKGVLRFLASLTDWERQTDARLVALMANANLKLGNIEAGADLFVRLAELIKENRAFFLRSAAILYMRLGLTRKLIAIGSNAIFANPDDTKLASDILHHMTPVEPSVISP